MAVVVAAVAQCNEGVKVLYAVDYTTSCSALSIKMVHVKRLDTAFQSDDAGVVAAHLRCRSSEPASPTGVVVAQAHSLSSVVAAEASAQVDSTGRAVLAVVRGPREWFRTRDTVGETE